MITIGVDTNVILRFFLQDDEDLFNRAKELLSRGESGEIKIYLDDLVIAEVIWTLFSFYKQTRADISDRLIGLTNQKWISNPHKKQVLSALRLFQTTNISYIDAWLLVICRHRKFELSSFDAKLQKLYKKTKV